MNTPTLNSQPKLCQWLFIGLIMWMPFTATGQTAENVEALMHNEQMNQALTLVDQLLLDDHSNRRLLLQKGVILTRLNLLDQAEAHYLGLIALLPNSPEPMNNLGAIYQLQGKLGKAVRQLNETIKAFPNFLAAYENLGDTYVQIAAHQYRNGLKLEPQHPSLRSKIEISEKFQSLVHTALQNQDSPTPASKPIVDIQTLTKEALQEATEEFMNAWAMAWSSQDVNRYFDFYAEDFKPSKNASLSLWKARKSGILNSAKFIDVQIQSISPVLQPDGQIDVSFVQSYESDRYKSTANKFMRLRHDGERFYITEES